MEINYPIRINKYLASKNYSTRIGADLLIKKGQVYINDRKAVLGDKVWENDKVEVDQKIKLNKYVYFIYNKPIGISTNKDNDAKHILGLTKFISEGSTQREKVFPIGRLDKDSHGLIILTNDGRITDRLLSPKYIHEKEYIVKTEKPFTDRFLENMQNGVAIGGYKTKKCKARRKNKNTFHIILTEGKKHQIRRMCEALHHKVTDLQRIRIMNLELGDIKKGEYQELDGKQLKEFIK